MRVLLVDRDPDVRTTLESSLQLRGHLVRSVDDYAAALDACRIQTFPLIIINLDCLHPDGNQSLVRLRQQRRDGRSAIVVLARSDDEHELPPPPEGATRVWPIPLAPESLAHHLATIERDTEADDGLISQDQKPPASPEFEPQWSGTHTATVDAYQQINEAVAERHHAETTLAEAEARYAELIKETGDTILVVQRHEVVLANDAAADLLGLDNPDQLHGRSLREFCHPDTLSRMQENERQERAVFEAKIIRRDGRVRTVQVTQSVVGLSGVPATQFILRDITPRRTAEVRRRQLEAQLQALLQQLPDTVLTVSQDGTITSASRSPSPTDLLGADVVALFSPHDRERLKLALERVFAGGASESFAAQLQPGNTRVWYDGKIGPVWDGHQVEAALIILREGSDNSPVAPPTPPPAPTDDSGPLLLVNAELERFAAIATAAARDCGALLGGATTQSAELLKDMSTRSPYRSHLEAIDHAVGRAASIADAVQRAALAGQHEPRLMTLGKQLREMEPLLRASLPATMTLRLEVPRTMRETEIDPVQLRRAVLTLALDAADAVGDRGTIVLAGGDTGDRDAPLAHEQVFLSLPSPPSVYLEVSDSAPAIDPETIESLGEPSGRIPDRRGLGLVAVLGIAQALEGALVVGPRPGGGNTVRLYLPAPATGRGNGKHAQKGRRKPS